MSRKLALVAATVAAFAFTAQAANAGGSGRHHTDPRLTAVSIGVGAAATAGFFAINDWKWKWSNSSGLTSLAAAGITTLGCAAVSPMVGTVVLNRVLTNREAGVLVANCVVPIVGGWLVNQAYDAHPEWEPGAPPPRHHRHHKM